MDLKSFIEGSIVAICEATLTLQEKHDGRVAPDGGLGSSWIQDVKFDG